MPNRIPTPGITTPTVRTSKAAQPAAKPMVTPVPKVTQKPAAKPTPNPTASFDKDVAARFKGGQYNAGDYKGPKGGDAASMQKTQNKMMGKK